MGKNEKTGFGKKVAYLHDQICFRKKKNGRSMSIMDRIMRKLSKTTCFGISKANSITKSCKTVGKTLNFSSELHILVFYSTKTRCFTLYLHTIKPYSAE